MTKSKRAKVIILCAAFVLIIGAVIYGVIIRLNPYCTACIGAPADKAGITERNESYCYNVFFSFNSSGLKYPGFVKQTAKERAEKISADMSAFEDELKEFEQPYRIEALYKNSDGKTVITFRGEVTDAETGELVPYEEVFTYDFVLTTDISADDGEMVYFSENEL